MVGLRGRTRGQMLGQHVGGLGTMRRATASIGRKLLVDNARTHARAIGVTAASTAAD